MNTKRMRRAEWAGSSNYKERLEELRKAHEEFQKMLENGTFKFDKEVRRKRPRIKTPVEDFKIVMVFGKPVKLTIEEYNQHYAVTVRR